MKITPDTLLKNVFRLKLNQERALERLGLFTVEDLLYHFPTKYQEEGSSKNINEVKKGDIVVLYGTLSKLNTKKSFKSKIPMAEGVLSDETGPLKLIWFNQVFIGKTYKKDRKSVV